MPQTQPRQAFGIVQNGGERDHTGPRGTRDSNGRARSCTFPAGCGDTAGIVKHETGCRPQADTTYHGQTRALGSASSGPGPATATAAPPTGAPEGPNVMVLPPREALRIVRICAADQQALCAGVPPGGGRIIACLMRNQAALSPLCKNALAMAQSR